MDTEDPANSLIKKTYTITFKTKVVNVAAYTKNGQTIIPNNAELSSGNGYSATANATYKIDSTMLAKSSTGYDYATRKADWQIVANQNTIEMPDAVIEDTINTADQTFIEGVTINDGSGDVPLVKDTDGTAAKPNYTYDASTGKLEVRLGKTNQQVTVKYSTTVTEQAFINAGNRNFKIYNSATIKTGIAGEPGVTVNAEKEITHYVILKGNKAVPRGQYYIDWTVAINLNELDLTDVEITDQLQAGLELDSSSVKLQRMTLNADGSQTAGAPVTDFSFTYTNNADGVRKDFTVKLPKTPVNAAYLLTFTTLIPDPAKTTGVTNTAELTGSGRKYSHGPEGSIQIQLYGGGVGYGTLRGAITLQKKDSQGVNIAQAGVEYALSDQYGAPLRTVASDALGAAVFNGLSLNATYSIQETKAPIGYTINNKIFSFKLVKEGSSPVTLVPVGDVPAGFQITGDRAATLADTELTAGVTARKTNAQGNLGLAGGRFAIYAKADAAFQTPLQTAVSGANGVIEFTGLKAGTYVIRELTPPPGYYPSKAEDNRREVTLTLNEQTNTLPNGDITDQPFKNEAIPADFGAIVLQKVDQNGAPLAGAMFGLYNSNGTLLQSVPSGSDGIVKFTSIPYGTYTIKELSPPKGYLMIAGTSASAAVSAKNPLAASSPYTIMNYSREYIPGHPGGDTITDDDLPTTKPIPQAGGFLDTTVLVIVGGMFIIAGAALAVLQRKRG